jgi:hypothetical protein
MRSKVKNEKLRNNEERKGNKEKKLNVAKSPLNISKEYMLSEITTSKLWEKFEEALKNQFTPQERSMENSISKEKDERSPIDPSLSPILLNRSEFSKNKLSRFKVEDTTKPKKHNFALRNENEEENSKDYSVQRKRKLANLKQAYSSYEEQLKKLKVKVKTKNRRSKSYPHPQNYLKNNQTQHFKEGLHKQALFKSSSNLTKPSERKTKNDDKISFSPYESVKRSGLFDKDNDDILSNPSKSLISRGIQAFDTKKNPLQQESLQNKNEELIKIENNSEVSEFSPGIFDSSAFKNIRYKFNERSPELNTNYEKELDIEKQLFTNNSEYRTQETGFFEKLNPLNHKTETETLNSKRLPTEEVKKKEDKNSIITVMRNSKSQDDIRIANRISLFDLENEKEINQAEDVRKGGLGNRIKLGLEGEEEELKGRELKMSDMREKETLTFRSNKPKEDTAYQQSKKKEDEFLYLINPPTYQNSPIPKSLSQTYHIILYYSNIPLF